jgi:two-component system CheB/CheR fusion protein
VTDFFRDSEAFESLKKNVFPAVMNGRAAGAAIRIWVPGCSTGEEVYSIAIALLEFLGESASKFPIQIYGTDICESAVKIARSGIYPDTASLKMSTDRLERFFRKEDKGYRVTKAVRDCCIFSLQDVTSQPPINRLDLLSCRNLMIYLSAPVQKKLMETFFYALHAGGFLMLGSAESVGTAADLFAIVDKKFKIYHKKTIPQRQRGETQPSSPYVAPEPYRQAEAPLKQAQKQTDPVQEAERQVLDQFAPAWVLVNPALEIVQFRGNTSPYIEPARGQPTWSLMKMLHGGLWSDVRVLIHAALKEGKPHRKKGIKLKTGKINRTVDVEVSPVLSAGAEPHCLILFTECDPTEPAAAEFTGGSPEMKNGPLLKENAALREELVLTQKSLQSIIEDQNSSNEELQSANEEVMSSNEELQSTNEELETAKEELQSTNEELTTLNDELTARNDELDQLSNDFINLLGNANVSIVMVGMDLRIRRFTPMAEKLLKLITADIGRSLTDINLGFQIEKLEDKISQVIKKLETVELETQDRDGHWYSVRIRPYQTADNKIDGAVLVFVNIDEVKSRGKIARAADIYSEGIIQTVRDPLVVLDGRLNVEKANQAFYDVFKVSARDTVGQSFYDLGNRQWDIPELRNLLENVLPNKQEVSDFRVTHTFPAVGTKSLVLHARTLEWEGQKKMLILITLHDLTNREGARGK